MQRSDAVGLLVIDEEDNQTLLVHRISADDIYRRQEGAIYVPSFVGGSVVYSGCYWIGCCNDCLS